MASEKEYRINAKGSFQGHYIIAKSKKEAISIARGNPVLFLFGEPLQIHVWKTKQRGHYYPDKLTPYAKKKMKIRSVS